MLELEGAGTRSRTSNQPELLGIQIDNSLT